MPTTTIKYSNGIKLNDSTTIALIPPQPTTSMRGGIIAKAKTTEDLEVVIDTSTGKAYVTGAEATQSAKGLMSAADKTKLDGIAEGANNYTHASHTAYTSDFYKVTVDSEGHVTAATKVAAADITGTLGFTPADAAKLGVANGIATLDASGLVPSSQLPSFVDDVVEAANFAALPATGETGKIYVTLNDNLTYRWSGTQYVEISKSLALGETSSTAYAGDKGKANADAIANIVNGTTKVPSASEADNAGTVNNLTVETAVPANAVFTDTWRDVVDNLTSDAADKSLSAKQGKALNTALTTHTGDTTVHITAAERTAWNAKAETSVATQSANGLMSAADKTKLDGIAEGANNYSLPTAGNNALGGVKTTSTVSSSTGYVASPIIDGVVYYKGAMTGASSSAAGVSGLVPQPAQGDQAKFLRGDGVWAAPSVGITFDETTTLISFDVNA